MTFNITCFPKNAWWWPPRREACPSFMRTSKLTRAPRTTCSSTSNFCNPSSLNCNCNNNTCNNNNFKFTPTHNKPFIIICRKPSTRTRTNSFRSRMFKRGVHKRGTCKWLLHLSSWLCNLNKTSIRIQTGLRRSTTQQMWMTMMLASGKISKVFKKNN